MNEGENAHVYLLAHTGEFTLRMGKLLKASGVAWSALSNLEELPGEPPYNPCWLLMDGENRRRAKDIESLRGQRAWSEVAVLVVGGPHLMLADNARIIHLARLDTPDALLAALYGKTDVPLSYQPNGVELLTRADRRSSYRSACNITIGKGMEARIVDLSEGGAQLEANAPGKVGSVIMLTLPFEEFSADETFAYEVLHVRKVGAGSKCFRWHGRFINTSPTQKRQLRRVVFKLQTRSNARKH